ncbi:MAG TPA: hypothetical protein VIE65_19035, partial [Methylobacter sp.]
FTSNTTSGYINPSTSPYPIVAAIPEVLEFGEVDPAVETNTEKFGDKSAGSNWDQGEYFFTSNYPTFSTKTGIRAGGKPVLTDQRGEIDIKLLAPILNYVQNVFTNIIKGTIDPTDSSSIDINGIFANSISTMGVLGHPGTKSPSLTVLVDPDSSFATTAELDIFLGVNNRLRVAASDLISGLPIGGGAVDAGPATYVGSALSQLKLFDGNTLSAGIASSGRGYVMFSAEDYQTGVEGDLTMRIADKDVSNYTTFTGGLGTFRKSILKKLNAITVSVGDGTNSFGDFNGSNAIQKAINFANSKFVGSQWSLTINAKRGIYISAGDIIIPTTCCLIINGDDSGPDVANDFGTVIKAVAGVKILQTGVGGSTYIESRNVKYSLLSGTSCALIDGSTSDKFVFKDCLMYNVGLHMIDPYQVQIERSNFISDISTFGAPTLSFEYKTFDSLSITARDTIFVGTNDNPILRIQSSSVSAIHTGTIRFNECDFQLGTTTVDANNNMIGNCGLVDLKPNGHDGIVAGLGAIVDELAFNNCRVEANVNAGAVSCLLHLIPCDNGSRTSSSPFVEGTHPGMRVIRFSINGGHWKIPRLATAVNPFTIGLAWYSTSHLPAGGRVDIRDVEFEFDLSGSSTFSMGSPTQDCGSFFANSVNGSAAVAQSIWGAFAIAANQLNISGVTIRGTCQQGGCGDLFLKVNNLVAINGLTITDYVTGTVSSAPNNRVRLRFSVPLANIQGSIRNLTMLGTNATSGSWVGNDKDIIAYEPAVAAIELDNCTVDNFTQTSSNSINGITIVDAAAGSLFVGYTAVLSYLKIRRSTFSQLGVGIKGVC